MRSTSVLYLLVAALLAMSAQSAHGAPGRAPVSHAGADATVPFGSRVRLNGLKSASADNEALGFEWTLVEAPAGGAARLENADTPQPILVADRIGRYVVQLVVNDGRRDSAVDTVVIEARTIHEVRSLARWVARGGSDVDGDGVPDDMDNCVNTPNPDQIDTNSDGFGNRCDPDLDNDGLITNTLDLGLLRLAFFSTPAAPNWNPDADFNGDNIVNVIELGILKQFFFMPPGPIANTFINPAGGSWHDPANWSLGFVPNPAHSVRIDLNPGTVVEYSSGSSHIHSMRATSDFVFSGGDLEVTEDFQVSAPFALSGGEIVGADILAPTTADDIQVSGTVTLNGVSLGMDLTLNNASFLNVENGLTLDGATITLASNASDTVLRLVSSTSPSGLFGTGEVRFGGTVTNDIRNKIDSFASSPVTIAAGVTVRTDTTGGQVVMFGGPLMFEGVLESSLAGRTVTLQGNPLTFTGNATATNGGHLTLNTGTGGSIDGPLTATGGGDITISGGGSFTIESGVTISVTDGELALLTDFVNEGTLEVINGVLDLGDGQSDDWQNNGVINLTGSSAELGGTFTLSSLGSFNTTGDVLFNGFLDNTGQTLDVGADFPGNFILAGGEIIGGTIATTPLVVPASTVAGTLNGVTLATDLTLNNGSFLNVENGLTLDGATITLASNASDTVLRLVNSTSPSGLFGTGEVRFGGTVTNDIRNKIDSFASSPVTIAAGVTVRTDTTGGQVVMFGGPLMFEGVLESSLAGRTVTLQGNPLTFTGNATATNGGHLTLNTGTGGSIDGPLTATGGGDITISGGGSFTIESGVTISVTDGELALLTDFVNEGTLEVINGVLDLGDGQSDDWQNNGVINLTGSSAELGGTFTLSSLGSFNTTGDVLFNGFLDNTGQTLDVGADFPGNFILAGGEIIGGTIATTPLVVPASTVAGTLNGVTLATDLTLNNGSFLNVENGLTLDGATITLASNASDTVLRLVNSTSPSGLFGTGEVRFGGTVTNDIRNKIDSFASSPVTIAAGVTVRTDTTGGQVVMFGGPLMFEGVLESSLAGRTVTLQGNPLTFTGNATATNGGHLTLNTGTGGSIDGPLTATGGGDITISGGGSFTIESGVTISVTDGELALLTDFVNEGTLEVINGVLDLGDGQSDDWQNNGVINLTGSSAELGGTFMLSSLGSFNTSGDVLFNGFLDNTGQTLDVGADFPGNFILAGGEIIGGTIATTPLVVPASTVAGTLNGVTLATDLTLNNGSFLNVENGLTLDGATITLASNASDTVLRLVNSTSPSGLFGTGEVRFGGTVTNDIRNKIDSFASSPVTIAAGVTVRTDTTGGQVVTFGGPLMFEGVLESSLAGRTVSLQGNPLSIAGTLDAAAGATINLASDYTLDPAANVNIQIGGLTPADHGQLTAPGRTANLGGTLNATLVNGFTPADCDELNPLTWGARSGTFDSFNGPDFGGGSTFTLNYLLGSLRLTAPGTCANNLSLQAGVVATASSEFSGSYIAPFAIDGVNTTNSSWCTANFDPAPWFDVTLPADATIESLTIITPWSPTYDFLTGRFELYNAADVLVFDSGTVSLTLGEIDYDVSPDQGGIRRVRFVGETWNSIEPCFGEFEVNGFSP